MDTLIELGGIRRDNAGLIVTPALPPDCKGQACPAFAICQGRCETRRAERPRPITGYPGGATDPH